MSRQNNKGLTRISKATVPEEAIEAVLGGDPDRFAELVGNYRSFIAGVCHSMGVDVSDVDDLVSQVLFKIYKNLHRYDPRRPFSNWIAAITKNHVRDYFRERAVRQKFFAPFPDWFDPPAPETGDAVERKERIEGVLQGLRRLPDRYRDILILKYLEERTITRIAGILALPVSTVKTRLVRGRRRLRRILANTAVRSRTGDGVCQCCS